MTPEKSRPWTSGPWTGIYHEYDGIILGHGGTESSFTDEDETLALAAPDLYEALEEMVEWFGGRFYRAPKVVLRAEAALKKARGEKSEP